MRVFKWCVIVDWLVRFFVGINYYHDLYSRVSLFVVAVRPDVHIGMFGLVVCVCVWCVCVFVCVWGSVLLILIFCVLICSECSYCNNTSQRTPRATQIQ